MIYMGSKARIVDEILPIMLDNNYSTFVDVFTGSCSVIQNVPSTFKRIANDANPFLIGMWKYLVSGEIEFPDTISRELYAEYRTKWHARKRLDIEDPTSEDALIGWIGFMASYNGRFFDGGYSGHCVDTASGEYDYIARNIRSVMGQIQDLNGVEFTCSTYERINLPSEPSIIYCDPPYKSTKKYCYGIDHELFWEWCRQLSSKGHKVYISEYDAPADFSCVWEKSIRNNMYVEGKAKYNTEKLFTYYG